MEVCEDIVYPLGGFKSFRFINCVIEVEKFKESYLVQLEVLLLDVKISQYND
jgi:hypothetical protein